MKYVLITVSKGIIDKVIFYDEQLKAIRKLSNYAKTMNPEHNDATLYDSVGMIANAKDFFDEIRKHNIFSSFFVCGHAQKNIEAMCETGPDNISIDENIQLDYVKNTCQKYGISFGGNLQLTVSLLMGSEADVKRDVLTCLDKGGEIGFILSPGCDLPYAVPVRNMKVVTDLVYDSYQRQVARELLEKNKAAIAKKWFNLAAQTYAFDTAEFLKSKTDPFANPIGSTMMTGLDGILEQLMHVMDPESLRVHLDPIIRIRAVQDFTPSQATAFILLLKKVLREYHAKELQDSRLAAEFVELESKIDQICLMAFDIYMQCREKVYQISANETRKRTFKAFERAGLIKESLE